jgi:hypothetical protein
MFNEDFVTMEITKIKFVSLVNEMTDELNSHCYQHNRKKF